MQTRNVRRFAALAAAAGARSMVDARRATADRRSREVRVRTDDFRVAMKPLGAGADGPPLES